MKVELKQIVDQLTEALSLLPGWKVAACFNDENGGEIVGWTIVNVDAEGTITPVHSALSFKNIKELLHAYSEEGF